MLLPCVPGWAHRSAARALWLASHKGEGQGTPGVCRARVTVQQGARRDCSCVSLPPPPTRPHTLEHVPPPQIKRTEGVSTTDIVGRMLTCTRSNPFINDSSAVSCPPPPSCLSRRLPHFPVLPPPPALACAACCSSSPSLCCLLPTILSRLSMATAEEAKRVHARCRGRPQPHPLAVSFSTAAHGREEDEDDDELDAPSASGPGGGGAGGGANGTGGDVDLARVSNSTRTQLSKFLPTSRRLVQFSNGRIAPDNARIVYIDGAFDVFHPGHVKILKVRAGGWGT